MTRSRLDISVSQPLIIQLGIDSNPIPSIIIVMADRIFRIFNPGGWSDPGASHQPISSD